MTGAVLSSNSSQHKRSAERGGKIVFTTFGSHGDLNPYLAIALGLRHRGHHPVIATSASYAPRIREIGLDFYPVRPDLPPKHNAPQVFKEIMGARSGTEYLLRRVLLPYLRESFADLSAAVRDADLLISHPTTFAAPIVAESERIPWASTVLSPLSFLSVFDTLAIAQAPGYRHVKRLGPGVLGVLRRIAKRHCLHWFRSILELRAELGLPPPAHPIFEGQHSPDLVLALFSVLMGKPQPDWPTHAQITGFTFFDSSHESALAPRLAAFLGSGPPPIVFTLGTLAVRDAGAFFIESAAAAERLNSRALLLVGSDPQHQSLIHDNKSLPAGVIACDYAPYSAVFPRASAIVHQAGIGTTAEALRAGRPMLVMPCAHDQPDNAARAVRIGVAREIKRHSYNAESAASELAALLSEPSYASCAAAARQHIAAEDGVTSACDAIEEYLSTRGKRAHKGR